MYYFDFNAIEFPSEFSNIIDFIFYPNVITFSSGSKVCQTAYTFLLRDIIKNIFINWVRQGLLIYGYKAKYNLIIPVKSHAFSVRVTLQGIQSRSHAHPHYHANTKLDEFENFSEAFCRTTLIAVMKICPYVF
jgi:hypothetical protein